MDKRVCNEWLRLIARRNTKIARVAYELKIDVNTWACMRKVTVEVGTSSIGFLNARPPDTIGDFGQLSEDRLAQQPPQYA